MRVLARRAARRAPGARVVMLRSDRALVVARSGLVREVVYQSETPILGGGVYTLRVASSRDAGAMDGAIRLVARTLRIYYGDADPRRIHPNPAVRALIRRSRLVERAVPRFRFHISLPLISVDEILDVEHNADVVAIDGETFEIQRDGIRYERDPDTRCYTRTKTRPIHFVDPFANVSSYAPRLSARRGAAGGVVLADYLNIIGFRERDAVELNAQLRPTLAVRRFAGISDIERYSYPSHVEIPPAPTAICRPLHATTRSGLARRIGAALAHGGTLALARAAVLDHTPVAGGTTPAKSAS